VHTEKATQRKKVLPEENPKTTKKSSGEKRKESKSSPRTESSESKSASLKTRPATTLPATLSEPPTQPAAQTKSKEKRSKSSADSSMSSSVEQAPESAYASRGYTGEIATIKARIVSRTKDGRPVHRDEDSEEEEESTDSSQEHSHDDESLSQQRPTGRAPEKSAPEKSASIKPGRRDTTSAMKASTTSPPRQQLDDASSNKIAGAASGSGGNQKKNVTKTAQPISASTRSSALQSATADKRARFQGNKTAGFTPDNLDAVKALRAAATKVLPSENQSRTSPPAVTSNRPLAQAVQKGNVAAAQALIAAGSNVNEVDDNGDTPLAIATRAGDRKMTSALILAGGDVHHRDVAGLTLLDKTALLGFSEIARLLINGKANMQSNGLTVLGEVSRKGLLDYARFLIDANTDVNKIDNFGNTPLMGAAASGYTDLTDLLVKAGAHVGLLNKDGFTALELAVSNGHADTATAIIRSNGDFAASARSLFHAVKSGDTQAVIHWLDRLGFIVNENLDKALLDSAISSGFETMVDVILSYRHIGPESALPATLFNKIKMLINFGDRSPSTLQQDFCKYLKFRLPISAHFGDMIARVPSIIDELYRHDASKDMKNAESEGDLYRLTPGQWTLFLSVLVTTSEGLHELCNHGDALMTHYRDHGKTEAQKLRAEVKEQARNLIQSSSLGSKPFHAYISGLTGNLHRAGVLTWQEIVIALSNEPGLHPPLARLVADAWGKVPIDLKSSAYISDSEEALATSLAKNLQSAMQSEHFMKLLEESSGSPLIQTFVMMQINALQSFCMRTLLQPQVDPSTLATIMENALSDSGKSFKEAAVDLGIAGTDFDLWTQPR
jgi:ankyrin repeat protein